MRAKVKEGCKAFFKGRRLKAGDIFALEEGDIFSDKWMIKLESPKPVKKAQKSKASKTIKKEIDV